MFVPVTGKADGNGRNTIIHKVYTIAKTLTYGPHFPRFHSPSCNPTLLEYREYSMQPMAMAYVMYKASEEREVMAPNAT